MAETFTVTVTNENGAGSLRQAILDANSNPGPDLIHFNIASAGKTIVPTNALPAITEAVTIDGTTQPGYSNAPLVELNGQSAGTVTDGLRLWGGGITLRGLVINRFNGDGIEIATNGNNFIEGCWIGLGADGTTRRANANGIYIINSPNNTIGGIYSTQRNLITGNNQNGVRVEGTSSSGTTIVGNWIGLNVNSATGAGNTLAGVLLFNAPSNTVGGTTPGARNLLSGNSQNGVRLEGTNALANAVLGNFISLDVTGTTNRNNGNNGVYLLNAPSNQIGGVTAAARNVIAGNSQAGVRIENTGARGNRVLGNFIGTDVSGALPRGNTGEGVYLLGNAFANTIGGTNAGEANVIAHSGSDGIYIQNGTNNVARANAIHSNGGLGIDLGNNGVQANDAGDADPGANQLQNFPILSAATNTVTGLFVAGSLNSRPSSAYTLDFYSNVGCDPSAHGEGQVWLGALGVLTGADSNANFTVTFPAGARGRFIAATATDTSGNTSEFSPCLRAESTLSPLTFVVTNTSDFGPGSLRQAILDNNAAVRSNRNTIAFAIDGGGPHLIGPLSALPALSEAVLVDGYTQSGASSNTLSSGLNTVLQIRLDGANAGSGVDGLRLFVSNSIVRGLAITRFSGDGIEISTNGGNRVEGCFVGLDVDGQTALGNTGHGIHVNNAPQNVIGGTTLAARNLISGNSQNGILLSGAGASLNLIAGNLIGTDVSGTLDRGNNGDGVQVNNAPDAAVGAAIPDGGNLISGNNGDGVELNGAGTTGGVVLGNWIGTDVTGLGPLGNNQNGVLLTANARSNLVGVALAGGPNRIAYNVNGDGISAASGTNNALRANAIFNNGGLGIDLGSSGVQANDPGDPDPGANQLQNFPLVTNATLNAGSTFVAGTLNSRSHSTYALDFFSNLNCDPSTNGEGQVYLGSTTVTTGSDSNAAFSLTLPVTAVGRFITATATDPFGNTSEFGPCFRAASYLPPLTFTVINTNDSGSGSLRQAILDNNATYFGSPNTIAFAIPGTGPHTIAPASALPDITEPVILDGFTQTNATPNTLTDGNNAVLQVRLRGLSFQDGLRLRASGCTVRGLIIVNWGGDGIEIANCDSNVVTGCFLGVNSDGTAAFNNNSGVSVSYGGSHRIGGPTPAERNAIIGIFLTLGSSNNVVQGNFIGCGLRGTNTVGFPGYGIIVEDSTGNLIGGTAPGARNIVSGNSGHAIQLRGAAPVRNVIVGNFIGPDVTGLRRLGNGTGVSIEAGGSNRVGGVTAAERNVISGNGGNGVAVLAPAFGNEILGNWFGVDATGSGTLSNSAAGIYLTGHSNRLGGTVAGEANVIAHSTGPGVAVTGVGNSIRGNSIHGSFTPFAFNPALGIDLGYNGVTPNDAGDADTGGNSFQNFPVLTAATGTVSSAQIVGTLNSAPGTSYALDFYSNPTPDPSGYGEGQTYLGSTTVVTDGGGNASFNVTLPRPLAGRFVTATATDPAGNTSEFAACLAAASTVPGAILTVTTTNDSGPGSLRQAILDANQLVTAGNTIAFAIPGAGVRVIRPTSPLPTFIEPVTLDGFTQTNASANTLSNGNNANWLIELNGSALTGGQQDGLRLNVPGIIVRGLRIAGFNNDGVEVTAPNSVVAGNLIVSNGSAGVHLLGPATIVGGLAPAHRNVLSANASYGVHLEGTNATANQILGNFVGTDVAGAAGGGSQYWGLAAFDASGNTIGGTNAGAGNVIAFQSDIGVFLQNGTNNAVRGNRIFNNGGLGIDLGFSGVTANDPGDADSGANQLQNFPVITNANAGIGSTQMRGTLNSRASTSFALDFFSSVDCHWSGHGQGQFYLGSASVTTDGGGNASFNVTLPVALQGNVLTATATDPLGNTSEFSPCFAPTINLPGLTYHVTNTADSGPGSLRQAISDSALTANSTPDQILFNIPGGGVKLISLITPLPEPEDAVIIDGFSQPGANANTSSNTDNAVILVQLDGSAIGFGAYGLNFTNAGNIVRGLSLSGFGAAGIALNSASNVVEGCWIGLAPSGLPGANTGSGLAVYGPANRIGGTTPAARNLISGHEDYGLVIVGGLASNNVVQGNFIGVGPSGTSVIGNGRDGLVIGQARDNLIGGTNAGAANLIGGSGRHGIRLEAATTSGNRIEGNYIGASFDFEVGLTNHDGGVLIFGANSNTVGGWAEETANVIAYNDGPGVWVHSGTQNGVIGNDIGYNTGQDILVSPGANDGVQPPILDWAVLGSTEVRGRFLGQPNTSYRITVMAERKQKGKIRQKRLGSFTVTTDGLGNANFDETLSRSYPRRGTGRIFANATCINSSSENSDGVPLLGAGEVDLVLDARLAQDPVPRGSNAVVIIGATNHSPTDATSVVVDTITPPGCNFVGANNPFGPVTTVGDLISCDLGSVPSGEGKQFTITLQPTLPGGGLYQIYSELLSRAEPEGFADDNVGLTYFYMFPPLTNADIAVTVELGADPIVHGEPHFVTVTVRNNGSASAEGITVTMPLPQSTEYLSYAASIGTVNHQEATQVVNWQVPFLAAGQSATLSLELRTQLDPVRGEPHLFTASAFAQSPADPNLPNNLDFKSLDVQPPKLDFSFANGNFSVFYPSTAAPFQLHSTDDLLAPVDFLPVPTSLIATAGQFHVFITDPATNPVGSSFFTLLPPPPTNDQPRLDLWQLSLNLDNFAHPFSEWGAADLTFKGQPGTYYFNLNVDDEWVVQNAPVTAQKGSNVWQTVRFNLPLNVNYGLPKNFANVAYAYGTNTLPVSTNSPPASFGLTVSNVAIPLYPIRQGTGIAGELLSYRTPRLLVGGPSVSNATAKPTFPNRPQGTNECAPAGVLNSLEYLNQVFTLNLSTQVLSLATIKTALDWTPAGAPSGVLWFNSWVDNKIEYMTANNLAIETIVTTDPNVAMEALKKNHDVELRVYGHVACVVDIHDIGSDDFALTLSHDTVQGLPKLGEKTEIVILDTNAGVVYGTGGWSPKFREFVIERPAP